jgi:20S proteasome alpha/beta subunit
MTVCIGALCRKNNDECDSVIVASDRMVTLGGFMEFEHDSPKVTAITPQSMIMVAGDTLRGAKLVDQIKESVTDSDNMNKIIQAASFAYSNCRDAQIDADIFRPRGLTRADFYANFQQRLLQQLSFNLDAQVSQFNYNVEMLIAGVDSSGAQLYTLLNPGTSPIHNNQLGYHAIGSGTIHALQSLIGFKHSNIKNIADTLFYVYASKRRAEVAPGVGEETDIYIISSDGIKKVSDDDLKKLEEIYISYSHPLQDQMIEEVKKLSIFAS